MAKSVLDIVIKLSKEGGADREAVKGLVQVKSALGSMMGIAGAVTGALYTAKKAFDFAKEGAQLQFVEQRFNRLGDSIGANSNLMGQLREVTRGLYSDTELMASASDLMGLGLAKNTDELMRLSKVSAGLNMNMNQLVLTLTNQTTMRFDALGVSVDGFKERVAELQAAGMDANEAFKEAFLQQAEEQLQRVGEAADSTAGAFMRFEAAGKNAMDSAKKSFAEATAPLISGLAAQMEASQAASRAQEENNKYNDLAKQSLQNLTGQVNIAYSQAAAYAAQLKENIDVTRSYDQVLMNFTAGVESVTESTFDFGSAMTELDVLMSGKLSATYDDYRKTLAEIHSEQAEIQSELDKWASPPEGSEKYDKLIEQQVELEEKARAVTEAYREQAAAIAFSIAEQQVQSAVEVNPELATQGSQLLNQLAYGYGMIDEKQRALSDSTASLIGRWAEGNLSMESMLPMLEAMQSNYTGVSLTATSAESSLSMMNSGLWSAAGAASEIDATAGAATKKMEMMEGQFGGLPESSGVAVDALAVVTGNMKDLGSAAFGALEKIGQVRSQMAKLNGMVATVTINIIVNGSIPRIGGGGGPGMNVAQCFVAGTLVTMADGSQVAIERIRAGDVVRSYDVDSDEIVEARVDKIYTHQRNDRIITINHHLSATPEHKIYAIDRGWIAVSELLVWDELIQEDGSKRRVEHLDNDAFAGVVYNLETDHETHNYFADGVLVHNGKMKALAGGGQWEPGTLAIVGDAPGGNWTNYTELITPSGYIIPNKQARLMQEMGLVPEGTPSFGFAESAYTFGSTAASSYIRPRRERERIPVTVGGTDRGGTTTSATELTNQTVTPLVETTEQAVSSVEAAQVQQVVEGRQTRAALQAQNDRLADLLAEQNELLRQQGATLENAVVAAVQQIA